MKKITISLLTILSILILSCDSNTEEKKQDTPPKNLTSSALKIELPTNAASLATAQAVIFNAYLSLFESYSLSGEARFSDGSWIWTSSFGSITLTVKATEQSDGSYYWEYRLNGGDGDAAFDNWKMLDATISADASEGSWNLYEHNSTTKSVSSKFFTENNNGLSGSTKLYESGEVSLVYITLVNPDGSGKFTVEDAQGTITFTVIWNPDGSGSWTDHSNASSGSW